MSLMCASLPNFEVRFRAVFTNRVHLHHRSSRVADHWRSGRNGRMKGIIDGYQWIRFHAPAVGLIDRQLREHDKKSRGLGATWFSAGWGSQRGATTFLLTAATARRSGVSSLLPPNDDMPLSFSMNSISGSESIKSSIFTVSVSTFAAFNQRTRSKIAGLCSKATL